MTKGVKHGGQMKAASGERVLAPLQLLLTSCARVSNHCLHDNERSGGRIKPAGFVAIPLSPRCQSAAEVAIAGGNLKEESKGLQRDFCCI